MKMRGVMKGFKSSRKGLSPIVATVLLVVLVMVLAAIVFLWARGFISEQVEKFGQPVDQACEGVSVDMDLFQTTSGSGGWNLAVANRGTVEIHHFDVKEFSEGNSDISQLDYPLGEGDSEEFPITFTTSDVERIVVYPVLLGSIKNKDKNTPYTCVEQGQTLYIN